MCRSKESEQLLLSSLERRRSKEIRGITRLLIIIVLGHSPFILCESTKFSEGG
jgi:hypothetical protein